MSCPASDCLDSLAQMAPHVIIIEPVEPHPHRNLYHDMIVNEKQVAESRTRRLWRFTQDVVTGAAHKLEACLIRQRNAAHKLRACLTRHHSSDAERAEALQLLEDAKTHKLAENYKANASSDNLSKRKQSSSNASTLVHGEEPESGEVISVRASFSSHSPPKIFCHADESPAPKKHEITITVSVFFLSIDTSTAKPPHRYARSLTFALTDNAAPRSLGGIPPSHETVQKIILEQRHGRIRAGVPDGQREEDGVVGVGEGDR